MRRLFNLIVLGAFVVFASSLAACGLFYLFAWLLSPQLHP